MVGNLLERGSYAFNNRFENDRQYKSESCAWSPPKGEGNEVSLWVSLPKHFASGQVECSPGSDNRKISGIGDQAWWEYQKFFGTGTLRVCAANAMLEVKVDLTSKDEARWPERSPKRWRKKYWRRSNPTKTPSKSGNIVIADSSLKT